VLSLHQQISDASKKHTHTHTHTEILKLTLSSIPTIRKFLCFKVCLEVTTKST